MSLAVFNLVIKTYVPLVVVFFIWVNIFIVDWKKKNMPEGPTEKLRCLPEQVKEDLESSGFSDVHIYSELPKHFLFVGKK